MATKPAGPPWKRWLKRIVLFVLAVVLLAAAGGGVFAWTKISAYDASMQKVYDIPPGRLVRSTDPAVIARGEHLALSIAGCAIGACHGPNLTGGHVTEGGPIGTEVTPNISVILPAYTDGEIERLMRHGVGKDGRSVRFMPSAETNWLPDSDVVAVISWLRTKPPVVRPSPSQGTHIAPLGKILDQMGMVPIDAARRIDHAHVEIGPEPSPTVAYGRYIGRLCSGCHGEAHLSGGPIPGAPESLGIPPNLTPHATGLGGWTYEDFARMSETGRRRNGVRLKEFMPVEALGNMDDTERRALWAYLQSLPPVPYGQR